MLHEEEVSAPKSVKEDEILAEWNVEFSKVEKSLNGDFKEHLPNVNGFVRSEPGGFFMMDEYARHAEKVYRFQPRNDDVWVVTFPKCGTTWTQELVWMIMNDCDKVRGKAPLLIRSPFLEFPYMLPPETMPAELTKMMVTLEKVEEMPSPRIIKSHLPFYLLHPKLLDTCKVVYVARNPKDVIVSFFHHHQLMEIHGFSGDVETFAQYFMDDELMFSPFFPHILDAWSKRHHPNMLFLFYE
ncbi:Sulfotransferase family cytosolic 1B member, partial [Daphnia magna]